MKQQAFIAMFIMMYGRQSVYVHVHAFSRKEVCKWLEAER